MGQGKGTSEAILLGEIEQAIAEGGFRWERYDDFVKVVLTSSDKHIRFCEVIDIGPEPRTLGSGQTFHVAFMTAMVLNEIPVREPEKEERCRAACRRLNTITSPPVWSFSDSLFCIGLNDSCIAPTDPQTLLAKITRMRSFGETWGDQLAKELGGKPFYDS